MKALDTPALLEILRGRPGAKSLLRAVAGSELATTEVNLLELEAIARQEAARGSASRLGALERLRHRLTVLPIDERATRAAAALARTGLGTTPLAHWLMWGAVESSGCSEWITSRARAPPSLGRTVKVVFLGHKKS